MLKILFTFTICLLSVVAAIAQPPIGIGEWRTHLTYQNAFDITDSGDKIYCTAVSTFFSYDKATGSINQFDKTNGLSETGVSQVAYDTLTQVLVVAYESANIDLIKGNTIINISDIKRKNIIGDNKIYDIFFRDSLAYLSTGFGIVVLDLVREEVDDTYIIGDNGNNLKVNSFTADSNRFYAATATGVKAALINSPFLSNFQVWEDQGNGVGLPVTEATDIEFYEGAVYVVVHDTSIFKKGVSNWALHYTTDDKSIMDITASGGYLLSAEVKDGTVSSAITRIEADGTTLSVTPQNVLQANKALLDNNNTLWIADVFSGLLKANSFQSPPTEKIAPNGPSTETVSNISINNNEVWVATGGVTPSFIVSNSRRGFYSFIDGTWNSYNEFNFPGLDTVEDVFSVFVHPTNGKVYFGAFSVGLIEFDNTTKTYKIYDETNTTLGGKQGFEEQVNVGDITLDDNGNLWLANTESLSPLVVLKPDGSSRSFTPSPSVDGGWVSQVIVDDFNQVWGVISRSGSQGLVVLNYGNDIDGGQASYKVLTNSAGNGNLPTNNTLCIAKDLDGEIWVGTDEGVVVFFCPSLMFSNQGCDGQQILVEQDGFAGFLLESEKINTIAIDGANRKWIGTDNGVFLLSQDGTEQIAFFDEDNSPLLSNSVSDIEINQECGEVFIATDKGIISYRSDATEGGETHSNVKVFPNPVRSDYQGPIAIKGLVEDADVKITDVNGHLIYQTQALGGQAIWDGRNPDGVRAKTGVYLVFSANDDGSESFVTKLVMIK